MATLTEGRHTAEFIVSEANGDRSREVVTIAKSGKLEAGAVLGVVTSSGKYKAHAAGAGNGTENAAAVLYAPTDATDADTKAVAIVRDAEVALGAIGFASGISEPNKTAAVESLADNGIIAR